MNVSLCCKEQLKGKSTLDHIQIDLITDIAKHLLLKCLCPPLKAFFSPKPIVSLSLSFFHYQEFPSPDHIFQEIAKSCLSAPLVSYFLSLRLRQSLTQTIPTVDISLFFDYRRMRGNNKFYRFIGIKKQMFPIRVNHPLFQDQEQL